MTMIDKTAYRAELLDLFNNGIRMMRACGIDAQDLTLQAAEKLEAFAQMMTFNPSEDTLSSVQFLLDGANASGAGYDRVRAVVLGQRAMFRIKRCEPVPIEEAAAYCGLQLNSFRTKLSRDGIKPISIENRAWLTPEQIKVLRK